MEKGRRMMRKAKKKTPFEKLKEEKDIPKMNTPTKRKNNEQVKTKSQQDDKNTDKEVKQKSTKEIKDIENKRVAALKRLEEIERILSGE